jgi:iron complex outermembrane receptor protein
MPRKEKDKKRERDVVHKAWLCSASILAATCAHAQSAFAQDSQVQDAPISDLNAEADVPRADAQEAGDIVVTGSRIARRDYSANSPIMTLGQDTLDVTGKVTIESALNQMPQFVAASGASSSGPPGNAGQANANLRGLGPNRSLILLDGRRMQASNANGSIDLNTVPDALIESVETITGGASAIYGSDAMGGVVNFRLRRNFTGFETRGQYSLSSRGDAHSLSLSLTTGGKFADDRGRAVVSASYVQREGVMGTDRPFELPNPIIQYLPQGTAVMTSNAPSQAAVDALFATYGVAPGSVLPTMQLGFNNDGTLFSAFPVVRPIANYRPIQNMPAVENFDGDVGPLIVQRGNSLYYNTGAMYDLQIPLTRYTVFGRADYELVPDIRVFFQTNYIHYVADRGIAVSQAGFAGQNVMVPITNPFIPQDLRGLLASRPNPTAPFQVNKAFNEFGKRIEVDTYNVFQGVGGFEGNLPIKDWTFELYASYGRTDFLQEYTGTASVTALQRLLNATDGGASLCQGGYNIFGVQPLSQSCAAYLERTARNKTVLEQDAVELNLQGGLFQLPAGEVRFAAGAGYRRNSFDFAPDALVMANDIFGYTAAQPAGGKSHVREVYGELLIPVLRDLPLIQELNLDVAYRYSDYDPSGGVDAYTVNFDWEVTDHLRLRGGYQRGVRAPALSELYAAATSAAANIGVAVSNTGQPAFSGDPCDIQSAYRQGSSAAQVRALCIAQGVPAVDSYVYRGQQVPALTTGNPNLEPEAADTFSAGAVWSSPFSSPWLSGFAGSIDYYNIKINKAIGMIGLADSIQRCFNGDGSNPNYDAANFYCRNLVRQPSTGNLLNSFQPLLNLGQYKTSGVDVALEWRLNMAEAGIGDLGDLRLRSQATWLDKFIVQDISTGPMLDYAGTTGGGPSSGVLPEWRAVTSVNWSRGPVSLGGTWRYYGSVVDRTRVTNPASTTPGVPAYSYFDVNARYDVSKFLELRLGVTNLTDRGPPIVGGSVGLTDKNTYDVLGRMFFMGAQARF